MTTDPAQRTKTHARLALSFRQRRFEWQLARDQQTRAAAALVSGKTHDLLNLVQIVKLASLELEKRCDATGKEFLDDLTKAAESAQASLSALMAVARPDEVVTRGAPVGPAVAAAIESLKFAVPLDVHLAPPPDTATRCTAEELEHLLVGLALDLVDYDTSPVLEVPPPRETAPGVPGRVELFVRERALSGKPFIEIMRSSAFVPPGERFELKTVEAIAERAGGELSVSERRGGGEDVVVALPVV